MYSPISQYAALHLIPHERRHRASFELEDLKAQRDGEDREQQHRGQHRGPQDLTPRCLAQRDTGHDPDTAHSPRSSPTSFTNKSSSDSGSGVMR